MRNAVVTAISVACLVSACDGGAPGVATPLPVTQHPAASGTQSSPDATQSGIRTVLTPLGINFHSDASLSSAAIGSAARGTTLTVKASKSSDGGWYQVQGATTTGWIVADPALTAPGYFQSYSSTDRGFAAYYPQNWTFAEEAGDVAFRPQQGNGSIVVTTAPSRAALGTEPPQGDARTATVAEVICGVTGDLNTYTFSGAATPTPIVGTAPLLAQRQSITLQLDATHYMRIAYNYQGKPDPIFADFYNSMSFPFPACEQTTTPTPSPT